MKTSQTILLVGGVAVLGIGAYLLLAPPRTPAGIPPGSTYIPPGGAVQGYQNNSGVPAWVTTTGAIMGMVNGVVTSLGSLPWGQWTGGGTTGG
jgi:hypothetical protein